MTVSINSLAGKIPIPLLIALVEKGVWHAAKGLTYARQMANPESRAAGAGGAGPA